VTEHNWLSVPEVADRLGVTPTKVRQFVEERQLAGSRHTGVFLIPEDLLDPERVMKDLPGTITVLIDGGFTEEDALEWVLSEHDVLKVSPVEALRLGKKAEVRRLAQALAV
jgi:excisionase family DNA binding protein